MSQGCSKVQDRQVTTDGRALAFMQAVVHRHTATINSENRAASQLVVFNLTSIEHGYSEAQVDLSSSWTRCLSSADPLGMCGWTSK